MTKEQQFFLRILSDHLGGRPTEAEVGIDWESLCSMALIHQVEGMVYYQLRKEPPPAVEKMLAPPFSATVFCSFSRKTALDALEQELQTENIPYFFVKGYAIAGLYPVEALRTMGDVDIVVPAEARSRVHEIMLSQGFVNQSHILDREWIYENDGLEYELHDRLSYREDVISDALETYFNDFTGQVDGIRLKADFHFLFLIFHMRKHLMNSGVGFRQFMDIAVFVENGPALDWPWILREAERLSLRTFMERVLWLCHVWFSMELPVEVPRPTDGFADMATEQIFRNGVFGFDHEENKKKPAMNVARGKKLPAISMLLRFVRGLFPSYKAMIVVDHYAFLRGRPYLLPAAWLYRVIRSLCGKTERSVASMVGSSYAGAAEVRAHEKELTEWGL